MGTKDYRGAIMNWLIGALITIAFSGAISLLAISFRGILN
jgi:hypothetical protein